MTEPLLDLFSKQLSLATTRRTIVRILSSSAGVALMGRARAPHGASAQATPQGGTPSPVANPDPGALIRVTADSTVGVLLEEMPASMLERAVEELVAMPEDWWIERARQQIDLTGYRLVYRTYYYDETRQQLPLPPVDDWSIALALGGPRRTTINGHDLVTVDYTLATTILTDWESPAISEPALADVGGTWNEEFVLPVDPTLIMQRTGYACLSESEYPPEIVAAETVPFLFDDQCDVETLETQSCHLTEPLPDESCIDAIDNHIGRVDFVLTYERLPWDTADADRVRRGPVDKVDAPDFEVVSDGTGLGYQRLIYRYFSEDHCALVEGCIGAPGWRRLLTFNARNHNVGGAPMIIGEVDYGVEGFGGELIERNVYQFADCHHHYHFQQYGLFTLDAPGAIPNNKNGFCIESTDRLENNETTPLHSPFSCYYQGLTSGWGDLYISSVVCNWVDVTDVDTSGGPVTSDLAFHFNPDGFLCEGTLEVDEDGNQLWEETEFQTDDGETVWRPLCTVASGTMDNNVGASPATLPLRGGMVSQPCQDAQVLGPLRNCGFTMLDTFLDCAAGTPVTLSCTGEGSVPQAIRVCETSRALGTGIDCSLVDALANVVLDGETIEFEAACPGPRDALETGGQLSIYIAPIVPADPLGAVTCTIKA